ncbi:MAG: DsbA family protein [Acidobacteria bacterium]|nr:DsbA family protein [Acidobacteriota bacterium]
MTCRSTARGLLVLLSIVLSATGAAAQSGFISIDDDPILGNPDAPVTIIEFGDYQCPMCRIFWKETMPRIKEQYVDTGKVQIVFRDFPQDVHPEASPAAMAAECAEDQGQYWEYHDKIFHEQDRRRREGEVVRFRVSDLKRWARDLGLDTATFDVCLDSERHKAEVESDYADASSVGVNGTPFFFVNGRVLAGAHPFSTFEKVIEEFFTPAP